MEKSSRAPRFKHGTYSMLAGQIVGALYSIPYKVLPPEWQDWAPFLESEHTQGLVFGLVSWMLYELGQARVAIVAWIVVCVRHLRKKGN